MAMPTARAILIVIKIERISFRALRKHYPQFAGVKEVVIFQPPLYPLLAKEGTFNLLIQLNIQVYDPR
jgi:hypothetical protein